MKRYEKAPNQNNKEKRRRNNTKIVSFPQDLCFGICEFLESEFVLSVARLISVDWWKASKLLNYSLQFHEVFGDNDEAREFLKSLFECKVLKDQLVSFKFTRNGLCDGIDIFKELKGESSMESLFPKLTSLDLSGNNLSEDNLSEFCSLFDENFMCNLTCLELGFNDFESGIKYIPNNCYLRRNLKKLSLEGMEASCEALSQMESLTSLNIEHCEMCKESLDILLNCENMKNLTSLFITNVYEVEIDEILAKSPYISNITELSIHGCSLNWQGNYFQHFKFSNLRLLNLSETSLQSPNQLHHLTQLEILEISGCAIGDHEIHLLCISKFTNSLKKLDISFNSKLSDHSIDRITSSFRKLSTLLLYGVDDLTLESTKLITSRLSNLTHLEIGGKGQSMSYQYFNNPTMKKIKTLKLFSHEMGDEGFTVLIKSPFLSNVEELWLCSASISNSSTILLASQECQLNKLRYLDLRKNEKLRMDAEVGKEWIQDEEEECEEDMTLNYVIRRNIPTLEKITTCQFE